MIRRSLFALMLAAPLAACEDGTADAICPDWVAAECPADYPNLSHGLPDDACWSNFDFACRSENCDREYEAMILCETAFPNCCGESGCNDASGDHCEVETRAWWDCTERLRDACRD